MYTPVDELYALVEGKPKENGPYWVEYQQSNGLLVWDIWWWDGGKWGRMKGRFKYQPIRTFGPIPLPGD